jgi:hypothetical protein
MPQDYYAVLVTPPSQAVAEAATNNDAPMTALRTAQAIAALGLKTGSGVSITVLGKDTVLPSGTSNNLVIAGNLAVQAATALTDSVFLGTQSGKLAETGNGNVAVGNLTLATIVACSHNVTIGDASLRQITTGSGNVAIGYVAATEKLSGSENIFVGTYSGAYSDTGDRNVMVGGYTGAHSTGVATTIGDYNIALGWTAYQYGEGDNNIAIGFESMYSIPGTYNIAIGDQSGKLITNAVATNNIFIGSRAGSGAGVQKVDAVNTIAIGTDANTTEDNSIRIGNSSTTRCELIGDLTCGSININSNWLNGSGPTNGAIWRNSGNMYITSDTGSITFISNNNGLFTARLYNDGRFLWLPPALAAPNDNGEVCLEFTSNTTITLKGKGTDGTIRSVAFTLA